MPLKPLENMTIRDDFMFYAVMQNEEICGGVIAAVKGGDISEVNVHCDDKIWINPDFHGIRLDVSAVEKGYKRRFDLEMQTSFEGDLPERTRYYHDCMDIDSLSRGKSYGDLPQVCVIMICDFQPFTQLGRSRYDFVMSEVKSGQPLGDRMETIFLSTRGTDAADLPMELRNFLDYVAKGKLTPENTDHLTERIEMEVQRIKRNQEWRRRRMSFEGLIRREREEGREEGRKEGRKEGRVYQLIRMSAKMVRAGNTVEDVASFLEEPKEQIGQIVNLIRNNPEDATTEELLKLYLAEKAEKADKNAEDAALAVG